MTIARGGDAKHYISTEAAYGTPKSCAAGDALKVRAPFVFSKNHTVIKNDEFQPGTIDAMAETATAWEVGFAGGVYLRGGASQGAAPDIDDLMLTGFTKETIVATTVASNVSTTTMKLAADYYRMPAAGGTTLRLRRYTKLVPPVVPLGNTGVTGPYYC